MVPGGLVLHSGARDTPHTGVKRDETPATAGVPSLLSPVELTRFELVTPCLSVMQHPIEAPDESQNAGVVK